MFHGPCTVSGTVLGALSPENNRFYSSSAQSRINRRQPQDLMSLEWCGDTAKEEGRKGELPS